MNKTIHPLQFRIYAEEFPDWLKQAAKAEEMLRLQDIDMFCGMIYTGFSFYRTVRYLSRYEHSIGTALITWHFTRDPAMTLASLYHDIATPVFSHSVDFMAGDHQNQSFTEGRTHQIIADSPQIQRQLQELGLTTAQVDDYHLYPIADNDSPQLSADRLEYTCSCGLRFHTLNADQAAAWYQDLRVGTNEAGQPELMFADRQKAAAFAHAALANSRVYAGDMDRYGMERIGMLLKQALERKILTPEDLWTRETQVIRKLKESDLAGEWYSIRRMGRLETAAEKGTDGIWLRVDAKKRWINPCVENQGRIYDLDDAVRADADAFLNQDFQEYICAR